MTDVLAELQAATRLRHKDYKDRNGMPAKIEHWMLSQWGNALAGETGELCNIIKKVDRGDFLVAEVREALGKEIVDVITYAVCIADQVGVDLQRAIPAKFNEVSEKIGSAVMMKEVRP